MAAATISAPKMEADLPSMSAAFEKERTDRIIVGETNGAVEGLGGLMRTVQSPHQISVNSPVGLVANHQMRIDSIQKRQSGLSPVDFGIGSRARHGSADGWREPHELIIECGYSSPIRVPGAGALSVHRLNGRLNLESPRARVSRRHRELTLGLVDQRREPILRILF